MAPKDKIQDKINTTCNLPFVMSTIAKEVKENGMSQDKMMHSNIKHSNKLKCKSKFNQKYGYESFSYTVSKDKS